MSLNNMRLSNVVISQFQFKLKAYIGVYSSLVILHVLALLFSIGGNGGGISTYLGMEISYTYYSTQNIISFTILWAFIHSIIMTTKTDWEDSFSFVGTRLSHDLSNIIFLFVASLIGGLLTILTEFLLRVIVYYFVQEGNLIRDNFIITGDEIFSGMLSFPLHLFLFCAIGYLLGTMTRIHRLMPVLVPVTIIGLIIALVQVNSDILLWLIEFYFNENSPLLFTFKIMGSVFLLFSASILISSRTEVRK